MNVKTVRNGLAAAAIATGALFATSVIKTPKAADEQVKVETTYDAVKNAADKATDHSAPLGAALALELMGVGVAGAAVKKRNKAKAPMEAIQKAKQAKVDVSARLTELDEKYLDLSVKQDLDLAGRLFKIEGEIRKGQRFLNGGYKTEIDKQEKEINDMQIEMRFNECYQDSCNKDQYSYDADHTCDSQRINLNGENRALRKSIADCNAKIDAIKNKRYETPQRIAELKDEYRAIVQEIKDIDVERGKIAEEYMKLKDENPGCDGTHSSRTYSVGLYIGRVNEIEFHRKFDMKYTDYQLKENPDDIVL